MYLYARLGERHFSFCDKSGSNRVNLLRQRWGFSREVKYTLITSNKDHVIQMNCGDLLQICLPPILFEWWIDLYLLERCFGVNGYR